MTIGERQSIDPGKLRYRLEIEVATATQTSSGAESVSWDHYATVWASIEPLNGRETLAANVLAAGLDTEIRMRWSPNTDAVTAKYRGRYRGVIYDFQSLQNLDLRDREIVVLAKSGADQG